MPLPRGKIIVTAFWNSDGENAGNYLPAECKLSG